MSYFKHIKQDVVADPNNSSTANLASAATFTGTATSTLGIVGIQVSLKTDQNCTVYVDQSPDGTNWDITDAYDYYYSLGGNGWTVQAVNSYVRLRVTNEGESTTTYFRLQLALCPIVESVPRSLSHLGRLKTEGVLVDSQVDRHVNVSPQGALEGELPSRLIGTSFSGTTKDTNFWTEAVTGSGVVAQDGEIQLNTGTTADSTAQYQSARYARFVPGYANRFQGLVKFETAGTANNVRRIGAYIDTDGYFFQLNGTTFGIGTRINSTDTIVNSGSFNGNLGAVYTMDTDYHKLLIEITPMTAFFYIDNILLHRVGGGHLSDTLTLPITFENINSGGQTADVVMDVLMATILRLGALETDSTYKHISTATTTICKYGAGRLHRICVNEPSNAAITIYDNTAGSGTIIGIINPSNGVIPFELNYGCPFSTGLTIVTAGTPDLTIIYE